VARNLALELYSVRFLAGGQFEAFDDLLFIHKDLAFEILWTLSGRLREANDKMAFMTMTGRF
jgi:CRP-like cAMP-binding protein